MTDYDMILMIEKGIRGGICKATYKHAKANHKYLKNYNKNVESHALTIQMRIIYMGWQCLKNYLQMILSDKNRRIIKI